MITGRLCPQIPVEGLTAFIAGAGAKGVPELKKRPERSKRQGAVVAVTVTVTMPPA
jgi:hypothetical protein